MHSKSLVVLLGLFVSSIFTFALAQDNGFNFVVSNLQRFQSASGGFREREGEPASLEATYDGLLLSTLFGLQKKFNNDLVLRFIQSTASSDQGYGNQPGSPSDMKSVRHAVLSYRHLNASVPNAEQVVAYIQSLYDKESHLFANRVGEKGDLRSTAFAYETLDALNQKAYLSTINADVNKALKAHEKDGQFTFSDEALSPLTANYLAVLIATHSGYQLQDAEKLASWVLSLQSRDGGFFSDSSRANISVHYTAHAVGLLRLLDGGKNLNKINPAVVNFVKNVPRNLRDATIAHAAALLSYPTSEVTPSVSFEAQSGSISGNIFVQGSKVRPVVSLRYLGAISHPNFQVEVSTSVGNNKPTTHKLFYNPITHRYSSEDSLDTSSHLGPVTYTFTARLNALEAGEVRISFTETRSVGYGIAVSSSANLAGKQIKEGENLGIGAELNFGVSLTNSAGENFLAGEFDVIFSVLDSSFVTIHSQSKDCRGNSKPISFSHTLTSSAVPSGGIICRFQVKGKDGIHTTKDISYGFEVPMIATEIQLEGAKNKESKLGETIKVSMEPASLPDLRTVHKYDASSGDAHKFFLDISSPNGALLRSVAGTAKDNKGKAAYSFSYTLEPTLDNVGTHVLSFRYTTAQGKDVVLSNYDSAHNELYDDQSAVSYSVKTDLTIDITQQPAATDFVYGKEALYRFRVKDSVSGKNVLPGKSTAANVYLTLKNEQGGRTFTSVRQAATVETGKDTLLIRWLITPNAVAGPGVVSIGAEGADGSPVPLFKEGTQKEFSANVNVGGEIDVNAYPFIKIDEDTAFMIGFTLGCQGVKLEGAHLRANLVRKGESNVLAQLQVANHPEGYQVSWTADNDEYSGGDYVLKVYREADKARSEDSKPLFEVPFNHAGAPTFKLPVKTEFLVLVTLFGTFFALIWKKNKH